MKSESLKENDMDKFIQKGLIVSIILLVVAAISAWFFMACTIQKNKAEFNENEMCKDGYVHIWRSNGDVGEGWYLKKSPEGMLIECNDK